MRLLRVVTVRIFEDTRKPGWRIETDVAKPVDVESEVLDAMTEEVGFVLKNSMAYYEGMK